MEFSNAGTNIITKFNKTGVTIIFNKSLQNSLTPPPINSIDSKAAFLPHPPAIILYMDFIAAFVPPLPAITLIHGFYCSFFAPPPLPEFNTYIDSMAAFLLVPVQLNSET